MELRNLKFFSKPKGKAILLAVSLAATLPFLTGCGEQTPREIKPNEIVSPINGNFVNRDNVYLYAHRNTNETVVIYAEKNGSTSYGIIYDGRDYIEFAKKNGANYYNQRYSLSEIESAKDVLVEEQVSNPNAIIVYIDGYGLARYYQNFQLMQIINLKTGSTVSIDNEPQSLVSDPENLAKLPEAYIVGEGSVR